jgi:hypothetical protein
MSTGKPAEVNAAVFHLITLHQLGAHPVFRMVSNVVPSVFSGMLRETPCAGLVPWSALNCRSPGLTMSPSLPATTRQLPETAAVLAE